MGLWDILIFGTAIAAVIAVLAVIVGLFGARFYKASGKNEKNN